MDLENGKSGWTSGGEEQSAMTPLTAATDDNHISDLTKGTCATTPISDRPWMVIDLEQEMLVYGVSLIPAHVERSCKYDSHTVSQ